MRSPSWLETIARLASARKSPDEGLFAGKDLRYMAEELGAFGRVEEIEIQESASISVEQLDDEITVSIAGIVGVYFQLTADQALRLFEALA